LLAKSHVESVLLARPSQEVIVYATTGDQMKQLKLTITAAIMILSTAASANCTKRPATGMFANTVAPSSVAMKVVKAQVSLKGNR